MTEISEGGIDGMHAFRAWVQTCMAIQTTKEPRDAVEGFKEPLFLLPKINSPGTGVGLQSSTMPVTM